MSFTQVPLETVFIQPKRMIGTIAVQVVVDENTTDNLAITKHPVQQGASITDHSYMEPTAFRHTILFSASGVTGGQTLQQIYQSLLDLQSSRVPFTIVTPKRTYSSMLIESLALTTNKQTENALAINASYQQVILVPVFATVVPRFSQKNPGSTGATQNAGAKESGLFKLGALVTGV